MAWLRMMAICSKHVNIFCMLPLKLVNFMMEMFYMQMNLTFDLNPNSTIVTGILDNIYINSKMLSITLIGTEIWQLLYFIYLYFFHFGCHGNSNISNFPMDERKKRSLPKTVGSELLCDTHLCRLFYTSR